MNAMIDVNTATVNHLLNTIRMDDDAWEPAVHAIREFLEAAQAQDEKALAISARELADVFNGIMHSKEFVETWKEATDLPDELLVPELDLPTLENQRLAFAG